MADCSAARSSTPGFWPGRLEAHLEIHLFRIAQQAVNNAITHGQAKRIGITLGFLRGKGTMSFEDDGVGIGEGYRARLMGASLEFKRRSPHGTVVTCEFPLGQ